MKRHEKPLYTAKITFLTEDGYEEHRRGCLTSKQLLLLILELENRSDVVSLDIEFRRN